MNTQNKAVFVGGLRSAFCLAHKGKLKDERPDDLLVKLLQAQKEKFPKLWQREISDFVVGCAYPEGEQGYNIGRVAALAMGNMASGMTVNRLCASSLEAVAIASAFVKSGRGENFCVGGVESMSRVPRRGANFSPSTFVEKFSPHAYCTMGETAENLCTLFPEISRSVQEEFAYRSHERASLVNSYGDENVRSVLDKEKIRGLKPAFKENGSVTAATSAPLTDGAAVGFVCSADVAQACGFTSALEIVDVVSTPTAPEVMGLGPVDAIKKLMTKHDLSWPDISVVEINEAFAIQVLACQKLLEIPDALLNPMGGAIANGHPLGASGLRLLMNIETFFRENKNPEGSLAIVSLCVGGGQGVAALCRWWDSNK